MRFRLLELFIVLTIACGAVAALRESTLLSETLFVNFTYGIVLFSLVFAVGRTTPNQVFWVGFLLASVAYLSFSFLDNGWSQQRDPFRLNTSRLDGPEVTTRISRWVLEKTAPDLWDDLIDDETLSRAGGIFCVRDGLTDEQEIANSPTSNNSISNNSTGGRLGSEGGTNQVGGITEADFAPLIKLIKTIPSDSSSFQKDFPMNLTGPIEIEADSIFYRSGESFIRIGHAVWALLIGWIIGHASKFVYERFEPAQSTH